MPSMPPDDPRSDQELVNAANRGDAAAFEVIYERYLGFALGLALRFTHDHDAARDVAHDAFLWLLKKFPGFELHAKLTTVLYPVVRHLALAQRRGIEMRKRKVSDVDDAAGNAVDVNDAKTQADADEALDPLAAAVNGLPIGQREALLLRYADDLSLAEIAAALEIPVGTVKSRLHLALAALRGDPALRKYFETE